MERGQRKTKKPAESRPLRFIAAGGTVPGFSSLGKYTVTVRAAPGGSVQLYAEKTAKERKYLVLEPWDEGAVRP